MKKFFPIPIREESDPDIPNAPLNQQKIKVNKNFPIPIKEENDPDIPNAPLNQQKLKVNKNFPIPIKEENDRDIPPLNPIDPPRSRSTLPVYPIHTQEEPGVSNVRDWRSPNSEGTNLLEKRECPSCSHAGQFNLNRYKMVPSKKKLIMPKPIIVKTEALDRETELTAQRPVTQNCNPPFIPNRSTHTYICGPLKVNKRSTSEETNSTKKTEFKIPQASGALSKQTGKKTNISAEPSTREKNNFVNLPSSSHAHKNPSVNKKNHTRGNEQILGVYRDFTKDSEKKTSMNKKDKASGRGPTNDSKKETMNNKNEASEKEQMLGAYRGLPKHSKKDTSMNKKDEASGKEQIAGAHRGLTKDGKKDITMNKRNGTGGKDPNLGAYRGLTKDSKKDTTINKKNEASEADTNLGAHRGLKKDGKKDTTMNKKKEVLQKEQNLSIRSTTTTSAETTTLIQNNIEEKKRKASPPRSQSREFQPKKKHVNSEKAKDNLTLGKELPTSSSIERRRSLRNQNKENRPLPALRKLPISPELSNILKSLMADPQLSCQIPTDNQSTQLSERPKVGSSEKKDTQFQDDSNSSLEEEFKKSLAKFRQLLGPPKQGNSTSLLKDSLPSRPCTETKHLGIPAKGKSKLPSTDVNTAATSKKNGDKNAGKGTETGTKSRSDPPFYPPLKKIIEALPLTPREEITDDPTSSISCREIPAPHQINFSDENVDKTIIFDRFLRSLSEYPPMTSETTPSIKESNSNENKPSTPPQVESASINIHTASTPKRGDSTQQQPSTSVSFNEQPAPRQMDFSGQNLDTPCILGRFIRSLPEYTPGTSNRPVTAWGRNAYMNQPPSFVNLCRTRAAFQMNSTDTNIHMPRPRMLTTPTFNPTAPFIGMGNPPQEQGYMCYNDNLRIAYHTLPSNGQEGEHYYVRVTRRPDAGNNSNTNSTQATVQENPDDDVIVID